MKKHLYLSVCAGALLATGIVATQIATGDTGSPDDTGASGPSCIVQKLPDFAPPTITGEPLQGYLRFLPGNETPGAPVNINAHITTLTTVPKAWTDLVDDISHPSTPLRHRFVEIDLAAVGQALEDATYARAIAFDAFANVGVDFESGYHRMVMTNSGNVFVWTGRLVNASINRQITATYSGKRLRARFEKGGKYYELRGMKGTTDSFLIMEFNSIHPIDTACGT